LQTTRRGRNTQRVGSRLQNTSLAFSPCNRRTFYRIPAALIKRNRFRVPTENPLSKVARSKLLDLTMIRLYPCFSVIGLLCVLPTMSILAVPAPTEASSVNRAKNLARMNCGAEIEVIAPDGRVTRVTPAIAENTDAAALIMEDDSVSCALREGETKFIIALPSTTLLDRFTFLNENAAAEGELFIAVSNYRLPAQSSKWKPVEGTTAFAHKRTFDLSLLGVEAKFVRLTFRVHKEGRVAGFGLYGQQSLDDFAARQSHLVKVSNTLQTTRTADRVNFNFASAYARARVRFVSSGESADSGKMIDDDPISAYTFSPNDPHPTVVVELSDLQRLHRISAIYDMQPGHLDVYALQSVTGDAHDFDGLRPIASAADQAGNGKASVDFHPQGARYIALRWTPTTTQPQSFRMAEIDAFGSVPLALFDIKPAPQLFAANTITSNPHPGSGGPDFSNTLGTLADPPTLPPPSP
jgi:hypothetical protein